MSYHLSDASEIHQLEMKTRSCRHLHFIAAIKSGSVTKFRNVNSCGNPALRFRSLKDIFEAEDAKSISSNSAVRHNKVKTEASYLPEVDRTLWEDDLRSSEFVSNENDDDMPDDSNMTLLQLEKIWRGNKRKLSSGSISNAKQEYDNMQFGEDEFDLKEPLIHWKQKLSKKTPKLRRKCSIGRSIRSDLSLSVKFEPILDSEDFGFANRNLSLVCVKKEDLESDSFEVPSPIALVDVVEPNFDTEIPDEVLEGHVFKNQELVLYGDGYEEYFPDPSEDIEIDGCDSFSKVLGIEGCQNCALNEVCYDHLEHVPSLEVSATDDVYASDEMMSFQPCVVSSTPELDINDKFDHVFSGSTLEFVMPHEDLVSHVSGSSNDSHVQEETSGHSSSSSGIQALDTAVNTEVEIIVYLPPATQNESFSSLQSVSSLDSHACPSLEDESVSTNEVTAEMDQSRACCSTGATKDCWNPLNRFTSNSPTTSEKESPEMVSIDSNSVSSRTATFLEDYSLSPPVFQNPGRLTRKITPPTSQERLCLAMSCEELHKDADEYECKEKLLLGEKKNRDPSIEISNLESARVAENTAQPAHLNRRKVVINPNQILQKEKNEKRGSLPKGNLEQPCYSRSLPCINTGCTSVKSCSRGAIAFSQRQMDGIDILAGKLLNELKSMKDIVEQKLLLNSCRNLTLRNDADEVVAAIKTATRVEENAKRLLSVMTRDCNRFCKIMSLTMDGPSFRENQVPRERRKIVFADEAGETLCHVKVFEAGSTSMGPPTQKPDNQNV